jgi:two-component system chemotaxis family response regulator WspR
MRTAVLDLEIPHEGSTTGGVVSISIGTATMRPDVTNSTVALIAAADEALYRAKRNGRNRVESVQPLSDFGTEIERTQVPG